MFTKLKSNNSIVEIITQDYILSTYVAIYINGRIISQFGTPMSESQYHKQIRISSIKKGDILLDGTILDCRSRYNINKFNKS